MEYHAITTSVYMCHCENKPVHVKRMLILHRQTAKVQICQCIHAVCPEPSLFTHNIMEQEDASDKEVEIWSLCIMTAHVCLTDQ